MWLRYCSKCKDDVALLATCGATKLLVDCGSITPTEQFSVVALFNPRQKCPTKVHLKELF